MATTIKLRRGTAAEWASANPVLASGEMGLELTADGSPARQKIGDGSRAWNALPYALDLVVRTVGGVGPDEDGDVPAAGGSGGGSSITGGRKLVATRLANGLNGNGLGGALTARLRHKALVDCTDVRLLYSNGAAADKGLAPRCPMSLRVGLEAPSGEVIPVTFRGKTTVTIEPLASVLSDPIPVDLTAGAYFWTRCWLSSPWGNPVYLAANAPSGSTTLFLTALPTGGAFHPTQLAGQKLLVDSEFVTVDTVTGTAAPYTLKLQAPTTAAHTTDSMVGQEGAASITLDSVSGDGVTTTTDLSQGGAVGALGGYATLTLAQAANIGDSTVKMTGGLTWPTLVLGTGGDAETVTVVNIDGTASPYTAYLQAPLTKAHASGATGIPDVKTGGALAPSAIVADRTTTSAPAGIIGIGDSIMAGAGFSTRGGWSFFSEALDEVRPYMTAGKSGETSNGFQLFAESRGRRSLLSAFPWVLVEHGTNDLFNGSTSLATLKATILGEIALAKRRGLKVAISTMLPRNSSTDGWQTTGNQTVDGTREPIRVAYNDWLRAGSSGADLVLELADAVETARNSGRWKGATGGGAFTTDGTHPTVRGHKALAAVLTAALPQIV